MATVQLLVLISVGSCRYFLPATRAEGGTGWVLFPVLAHPACTHQEPHPPHTQRKHCSGYTVLYDGCFRVAFYVAVCLGSKKAARIRLAERSLQKVPVFTWQDTHHSDGGGCRGVWGFRWFWICLGSAEVRAFMDYEFPFFFKTWIYFKMPLYHYNERNGAQATFVIWDHRIKICSETYKNWQLSQD